MTTKTSEIIDLEQDTDGTWKLPEQTTKFHDWRPNWNEWLP
jgi:hypothetical protein